MSSIFSHPFVKTLGPGILFASTAIGVSHIVQSTRAGAEFGFALIGFVILANLLKYPFFEFGSRYANATNTSIIDGYKKIGRWMLILYFGITIGSMFFVVAAVTAVTSGFFKNLFQIQDDGVYSVVIVIVICVGVLLIGKYRALDGIIKIVGIVLIISTTLAFILAASNSEVRHVDSLEIFDAAGILFLIALMGWMPTALDLSAWNSLWTLERIKQTGYKPTLKQTLLDFRIGYIICGVTALLFLGLGALIIHGTNQELPSGGSEFAYTIVSLFTKNIGEWSNIIISASAFSVMFGTILAVYDGYSRTINKTIQLMYPKEFTKKQKGMMYNACLIIIASGAFFIIFYLGSNLKQLVDLATTISFIIAPIIAIANYKLVLGKYIAKQFQPGRFLKGLSICGIAFLSGFTIWFITIKIT